MPIRRVYLVRSELEDRIELTAIDAAAAYAALRSRPHHCPYLAGLGAEATYLQLSLALAQTTPFAALRRPRRRFCLSELADRIEENLRA